MAAIKLLLCDDHPVVRDGLQAVLATQPDFAVVAEASDGQQAIHAAQQHQPDVILLDLEMPIMDGVTALNKLREQDGGVKVIVFTAFDTDERIVEAVRAGAKGYLLKGAPKNELFHAIRTVHAGGTLLQPIVATKLMQSLSQPTEALAEPLTPREQEVLELLARGLQNKEISAELHITPRTVKFHVSSLLGKLGAGNRTEAVTIAAQRKLIQL